METITMPNSMNMAPLPHSHEADVSDVLSLFTDPSMGYMGLGSGNSGMSLALGSGGGMGLGMGSGGLGMGMGSGNGSNIGLGLGMGSGNNSMHIAGLGSGSGPTLIISPATSTTSSPSLSHLSRNGVVRDRSRDSSSSLSSMDETTLGLSPNTLASFLNQPGSRTSAGSDNGMMSSPIAQTLLISPGSSLTQTLPLPPPQVVLSPPAAPDPRVHSPPMKSSGGNSAANNAANGANKKRKRPKVAEKTEVISNWETFYPPRSESFNLYNEAQLDIMNTFDLDVKIDSGNAVYSEEDNAWIFYRQNQFQIVTELLGSLSNYTPKGTTTTTATSKKSSTSPNSSLNSSSSGECILYVEVADYLRKVESLAMDVRIIKQTRNNLLSGIIEDDANEDKANQVKIFKVGMSRTKKENKSVEAISFVQGKATQSKLQFQSATANNAKMQAGIPNPNQQYFRIVVSLVAKIFGSEDSFHLLSKLSPPIIVRGQSPGRYPHQNQSESANEWKPGSVNGDDCMSYNGRVGINTSNPLEALTVHGNILVTGNIVKPSDVRLKSNFDEVRTDTQLKNIERLKIYDYNIKNPLGPGEHRERGVIAQEVQEAIPSAVQVLGDVTLEGDTHVPNLLVVNDHVLLLENLGATKHLSELLRGEQENIKEIDTQLRDLEASTEESENVVTTKLLSVLDYIASEESLENQRHCYCSFFGLGPAWSLFLLGFVFTGITWMFGIFYVCSTNHVKRVAGVANLVMAVVLITYYIILGLFDFNAEIIIFTTAGLIAIGALCMLVMSLYGRRRSLERQAALRQIKNILIQRYTKANLANNPNNSIRLTDPRESTPLLVKGSLADSDDSIESDDNDIV